MQSESCDRCLFQRNWCDESHNSRAWEMCWPGAGQLTTCSCHYFLVIVCPSLRLAMTLMFCFWLVPPNLLCSGQMACGCAQPGNVCSQCWRREGSGRDVMPIACAQTPQSWLSASWINIVFCVYTIAFNPKHHRKWSAWSGLHPKSVEASWSLSTDSSGVWSSISVSASVRKETSWLERENLWFHIVPAKKEGGKFFPWTA